MDLRVSPIGMVTRAPASLKAWPARPVVWARSAWRDPWRSQVAARVCVLVTGFHDAQITPKATTAMFATPAVRHWFGVQAVTEHPSLTGMPVGIDEDDVPVLRGVPETEKDVLLYQNYTRRNNERRELWGAFPWAVREEWSRGGLLRYAQMLKRSRFVLSPPGRGWDCYRTYEAILAGAIPIVRREGLASKVVEGLPVLMVDDWAEVTPSRLDYEWRMRGPTTALPEKLTMGYWKARIDACWQS
jgi:hypothetical protein